MIKSRRSYNLFILIAVVSLWLLLPSCDENDIPRVEVIETEIYDFDISLTTGLASRGVELKDGTEDEDYIGSPTFALYYNDTFLMDLNDKVRPMSEENNYKVRLVKSDFERSFGNVGLNYSEDLLKEIKFRVLVTSNWSSYDNGSNTSFNGTLTDLWSDATDYNFSLKRSVNGWQPSKENQDGIPMFGLSSQCKIIGQEGKIVVSMLRALAKIEILDVMKVPDQSFPFSIKSVTLSKCAGSGRLIPDAKKNPGWNIVTTQVTTPSLPSPSPATLSNLIFVKTSEEMTYKEAEGVYNKWICYVPEMDLSEEALKDVIIDLELEGSKTNAQGSLNYEIEQLGYGPFILRNNMYRFFVTGLKETHFGFDAILETDPTGDINFVNLSGNKWWLHKESVGDKEEEVWYKLVYHSDSSDGVRSHWEKEWYFNEIEGVWFKWEGYGWTAQEATSQGPYDRQQYGINTNYDFNEMVNTFLNQTDYNNAKIATENYFLQYGKTLEINGTPMNCLMLNHDVTVEAAYHVLPIHRDYVLYGNGHTVYMDIYGGPTRYNLGPVRDIYIQRPQNLSPAYRIYIDLKGNVTDENGNSIGIMEPLEGNNKSYNINFDGNNVGVKPDAHYNSVINK